MRPEIEWEMDEPGDDGHTVVRSPRPPTSRRHRFAVGLMIVLGIGLGVVYHAIPEPTPRPASLPPAGTPTPIPPPRVEDIIELEAHTLATGRLNDFMALQDNADPIWHRTQLGAFRTWGKPPSGPSYTIVASGTLPADRFWADVLQFRTGEYFRETRFYQLSGGHWRRIAPVSDDNFWGTAQSFQTDHFKVFFRARDAAPANDVARQFEAIYRRVCHDLQCADRPLSPDQKLQVFLWPDTDTPSINYEHDHIIYRLFSPRLAGLFYDGPTLDRPSADRPFNQTAADNILYYVARASVQLAPWPPDVASEQWLLTIADWERLRVTGQPMRRLLQQPELLAGQNLLSPADLWTWPSISTPQALDLASAESTALIEFVDDRYGPATVIQLLHQLGQTATFSETLDHIGLAYPQFDRDWQSWLQHYK